MFRGGSRGVGPYADSNCCAVSQGIWYGRNGRNDLGLIFSFHFHIFSLLPLGFLWGVPVSWCSPFCSKSGDFLSMVCNRVRNYLEFLYTVCQAFHLLLLNNYSSVHPWTSTHYKTQRKIPQLDAKSPDVNPRPDAVSLDLTQKSLTGLQWSSRSRRLHR